MPPSMQKTPKSAPTDVRLVERACAGEKLILDELIESIRDRLKAYLYRSTLDHELADEIAQETVIEIYRSIGTLKKPDQFWAWVRGISFNRLRQYYKTEHRHSQVVTSSLDYFSMYPSRSQKADNGVDTLLKKEQRERLFEAMKELKPNQRQIIVLRCFESMSYARISELMGNSEFSARVLFFRAKQALKKILIRKGLAGVSLIAILTAFGELTASAGAITAPVTTQTLQVGTPAVLVGTLGSGGAMASGLAAALAVAAGISLTAWTIAHHGDGTTASWDDKPAQVRVEHHSNGQSYKRKFYFPHGQDGPVMIYSSKLRSDAFQWLQNDHANYVFDDNAILMKNHRSWNADMSVRRLPTDSPALTAFLNTTENRTLDIEPVKNLGDNLLIISRFDKKQNRIISDCTTLEFAGDEMYFKYGNPTGGRLIDHRDQMHRRGWTWFVVSGSINGSPLSGAGRIPFVYETASEHDPWLQLRATDGRELVQTERGLYFINDSGQAIEAFGRETFFRGLSRPWKGLHCVDLVRRDAAEQALVFETHLAKDLSMARIVVHIGQGSENGTLSYHIDMEQDLVLRMTFESGSYSGEISFDYFQELPENPYTAPSIRTSSQASNHHVSRPGLLWPIAFAKWLGL